jgi:hypothetical protein
MPDQDFPEMCREHLRGFFPDGHVHAAQLLAETPKSKVYRCTLSGSGPRTLVLKHLDPHGSHVPRSARWFNAECSTRLVLGRCAHPELLVPAILSQDHHARILTLVDAGHLAADYFESLLAGSDPLATTAALCRYLRAVACLHARSAGLLRTVDWPDHQAASRAPFSLFPTVDETSLDRWTEAWQSYRLLMEHLGIDTATTTEEEIRRVAYHMEDPANHYLALCQGDQNGIRNLLANDQSIALIDFDSAGFRHMLLEGNPEMTWGCMQRVPPAVFQQLREAYQVTVMDLRPDLARSTPFEEELRWAWAWTHIFHVNLRLSAAIDQDWQRGASTLRQQVAAVLMGFIEEGQGPVVVPGLLSNARAILQCLRQRWPAETFHLPLFPVYRPR